VRPSSTVLVVVVENKLCKNRSIKGKTIMESFITMERKEVTSNSSKDLKAMMLRSWNVQSGFRR
jgi:hypothetical protein